MTSTEDKRAAFRALHDSGCFVLPNPWDLGTARYLQHAGFQALGTTSAGYAFSRGKPDSYLLPGSALTLEETLAHVAEIVEATDVPVNADFEDGFAEDLASLAVNVRRCAATGVAGLSIEDNAGGELYGFEDAVARVGAAREALAGTGIVLVARSEGFILGRPDLAETVRRLQAFAAAGADCLYAPGLKTVEEVRAVVEACAPKPVNVLVNAPIFTVPQLRDLGVRRISLGGALARAAWGAVMRTAREILDSGTFEELAQAVKMPEINEFLERETGNSEAHSLPTVRKAGRPRARNARAMKQSSTDVLVVGAGPVGLMMAGELTRHGVECLTVDRLTAPSPHSRAVGVEARTLEIFEDLGVLARAFERGLRVGGINVYREGRMVERTELAHKPTPEIPFPLVFSLEQSLTEQILTEHLTSLGGRLERGVEFTELSQDEDGVTALLSHQDGSVERVRCRYLIGCDGAESRVRQAVGIPCTTECPGANWRLWDVELEWPLTEGEVHRFEPDLICLPLRGVWRYQILSPDRETSGNPGNQPPTLDELAPLLPQDSSARELRWSSRQHINPRLADRYRHQRVFLAGDAAHLSGQGLNTGLQDAYNLAWKLALVLLGKSPRTLLDSYESERRPAALAKLQDTNPVMPADPLAALNQHYSLSPLVCGYPDDAELQAGQRAPDGTIVSGGMPVRVFQLLRGTRHHLLAFAGGAGGGQVTRLAAQVAERHLDRVVAHVISGPGVTVPSSPLVSLRDSDYQLHQAYGFDGPGVALVRPDGYLGFRADLGHVDELLPYLQGLFLPL